MEIYRRTVYGADIQTCQLLGLQYTPKANTTLNEKFTINSSATLSTNEYPRMQYMTIGIGGHSHIVGAQGRLKITAKQHAASDAALYEHVPFVMRPLDSDLSQTDMAKYGLRKVISHAGVDYAVYYARRLDLSAVTTKYKKKVVANRVETITDFVPDSTVLSPVAPATAPGATTTDGTYVYATATVKIVFDAAEVSEMLSAIKLLYGEEEYGLISEIGFVTGVDRTLPSAAAAGATFQMNEIVAAQVFCHVFTLQPLYMQRDGFEATYDIGISEPLMILAGP